LAIFENANAALVASIALSTKTYQELPNPKLTVLTCARLTGAPASASIAAFCKATTA
jgi:hypothetical protein